MAERQTAVDVHTTQSEERQMGVETDKRPPEEVGKVVVGAAAAAVAVAAAVSCGCRKAVDGDPHVLHLGVIVCV